MILGIEVGGTFTDLVLSDPKRGITVHKVPSTPQDPSEAAISGVRELLQLCAVKSSDIGELLHGSTIAANAIIQRRGARAGLVTTKGFADVLFNARANKDAIYDLFYAKPVHLLTRGDVFEVTERLNAAGEVVTPLNESEVFAAANAMAAVGIVSVAVCLLHSYANPEHERRVGEIIAQAQPDLTVTLSCDIAPEHREYERTSTTVISAYLRPIIDHYLAGFERKVSDIGIAAKPLIMQSNGGVVPVSVARSLAANMFLSGPAAAATGAAFVGRGCGLKDLITIDVGGTSSDVCLINGGQPQTTVKGTAEFSVDGLPLNVLMTDIVSIGAGGGSIASVDAGGMLKVGPQSAGANPGPSCYGRGGTMFTLSDAMLLMGLLDPDVTLAGGISLSEENAKAAAKPLCDEFQLGPLDVADRVYRIAIANMAQAVRQVSIRRGYDPRGYVLLPCGGVGPLIGAALADEIGMAKILIPPNPGVFSAFGLAVADIRIDNVRAEGSIDLQILAAMDLLRRFEGLRAAAIKTFADMGYGATNLKFAFSVDARYRGQGYELRVPIELEVVQARGAAAVIEAFHSAHLVQFGLNRPKDKVDVVSFRLTTTQPRAGASLASASLRIPKPQTSRTLTFLGRSADYRVIDRASLSLNTTLDGPCIVTEETSSTLVPRGWHASVDHQRNLHVRRSD